MAETITPENKKLLTSLGIAIAAYLLVVKPIFRALGLQKTPEELAKAISDAVNIADIQKNLSAKGIVLSKTKAEWDIIADTIYNDLKYSALNDNKADAGYQVTRVKNDADIIYLIQSFGTRQENLFGIPNGSPMTLPQFITSNLSQTNIDLINDNYNRKQMSFKF